MKTATFAQCLFNALLSSNGGFCTNDEKVLFEATAKKATAIITEKYKIGMGKRLIKMVPVTIFKTFSIN